MPKVRQSDSKSIFTRTRRFKAEYIEMRGAQDFCTVLEEKNWWHYHFEAQETFNLDFGASCLLRQMRILVWHSVDVGRDGNHSDMLSVFLSVSMLTVSLVWFKEPWSPAKTVEWKANRVLAASWRLFFSKRNPVLLLSVRGWGFMVFGWRWYGSLRNQGPHGVESRISNYSNNNTLVTSLTKHQEPQSSFFSGS